MAALIAPSSSTRSNFNSLGSTIDSALNSSVKAQSSLTDISLTDTQILDDMSIEPELQSGLACQGETSSPRECREFQPDSGVQTSNRDPLDDMRCPLEDIIKRTSEQLKDFADLHQTAPESIKRVFASYMVLYKHLIRAKLAEWQVHYDHLTDASSKRMACAQSRDFLLDVVERIGSTAWQDFESSLKMDKFATEMQSELDKLEVEAARICHQDTAIVPPVELAREIQDVDLLRLTRSVQGQKACLEIRFECISDLGAMLISADGTLTDIPPDSLEYRTLNLLAQLIQDQLVTFHFLLSKDSKENIPTIRDRLICWLEAEDGIDRALLRLPNGLGAQLNGLYKDLLEERAAYSGDGFDALSKFVCGRDFLASVSRGDPPA